MTKLQLPKILDSKTPKVYKNKKLNTANFGNFTHNDYQTFLQLISKIGGVDKVGKYLQPEHLQREHRLTAKEFSEIFNTDISNSYKILSKAVDKLMKTDIKLEKENGKGVTRINVCSKAEYHKSEGSITIKFTDDIMPYLAQVRQKFVLYNLKEIANFGSLYTTRLYELIQEFKDTGYVVRSVAQLRETFAVGNSFKLYNDFKKRTFEHACREINDNYQMNLKFEETKEGRKITTVKFIFTKTKIHKVINQHTGAARNFYEKPVPNIQGKRSKKFIQIDPEVDILKDQLKFENSRNEAQPIQNILSKFLKNSSPKI